MLESAIKLNLAQFTKICIAILGFIGTIQLVLGILKMTPELIGRLSQSFPSYSIFIIDDLAVQKADVVAGLSFISFSFFLQLITNIFNFKSVTIPLKNYECFLIIAAIMSIIVLLSRWLHRLYKLKTRMETGKALLKSQVEQEWFKHQHLMIDQIHMIEKSAKRLLLFERLENESHVDFLKRLGELSQIDILGRIMEKYRYNEMEINKVS